MRRKPYLRMDFIIVGLVMGAMFGTFGRRMADMEDLMAVGLLIIAVAFNGVLLLSNFWSVKFHEFFAYQQLDPARIDICTQVKVTVDNQKQNTIKHFIVPLLTKAIEIAPDKVSKANHVEVQKKRFSYSKEKKTFTQIPYPDDKPIAFYQEAEGIENDLQEKKADLIWGKN